MNAVSKERANQISGGVFIIGLGVILLANYFWPGILFLIGVTSIAQGLAEGRGWYGLQGGVWMIGLGVLFAVGLFWPGILIVIGVSMLVGYFFRPPMLAGKDDDDLVAP